MTTDTDTDTDPLEDRLWDAIFEARDLPGKSGEASTMSIVEAVLPIIREAQAEALRETADWWAANPDADVFETDGDTRNWIRDVATEYETGDSDEHR